MDRSSALARHQLFVPSETKMSTSDSPDSTKLQVQLGLGRVSPYPPFEKLYNDLPFPQYAARKFATIRSNDI